MGQQARERFGCWRENGHYVVPSEFVIRDCLVRIEPNALDRALDGKTMKNAIDEAGHQAPIMSGAALGHPVGHESKICHAQNKPVPYP